MHFMYTFVYIRQGMCVHVDMGRKVGKVSPYYLNHNKQQQ